MADKDGVPGVKQPVSGSEEVFQSPLSVSADTQKQTTASAGVFVLQWLSYAFWGWLILGLIWLIGVILTNAIAGTDVSGAIPYALASVFVLLPIAFVTDLFYRKSEPRKKLGAATVIMVVHAVIFALCGIGTLVGAVFVGLNMLLSTGSTMSQSQLIALLVLLFAAAIYGVTFLRTINPFKTMKLASWYGIGMLMVSVVLIVFGIVGPVVNSVQYRDDRRIEEYLPAVSRSVNKYIRENRQLPDSLKVVNYTGQDNAKALVDDGLVVYKKQANGVTPEDTLTSGSAKEYRYELCVTYKQASSIEAYDSYDYGDTFEEYSDFISTGGHPAGDVCYKVAQRTYGAGTAKLE